MKTNIEGVEYPEELVVIVRYKGVWSYYVSIKDFWILDQKAWACSYHGAGYEPAPDQYSERFDIPLVDENTAEKFLSKMKEFKVSSETLKGFLLKNDANGVLEEESEYFPGLYVDFDGKELISDYPEPFPFEKHIPPGWNSNYATFYHKIPESMQYWKTEKGNLLDKTGWPY